MQGVKINDKHFEVIVRRMMRKVNILDPGDTNFLEQQVVDKRDFMDENDRIRGKKVVTDAGDSENVKPGGSSPHASSATKTHRSSAVTSVQSGTRCTARHLRTDPPGYHPCRPADIIVHVGRIIPRKPPRCSTKPLSTARSTTSWA